MYNNYANPNFSPYNAPNFNGNPYGSPSGRFQPNYAQNGFGGFTQQPMQQPNNRSPLNMSTAWRGRKAI